MQQKSSAQLDTPFENQIELTVWIICTYWVLETTSIEIHCFLIFLNHVNIINFR